MSVSQISKDQISSFKKTMRVLYAIFAWLFALCILIQVFLAGLSIFTSPSYWSVHIGFAHIFESIPMLLLIFALLGRLPRAITLLSLLLIAQFALQYAFVQLSGSLGIAALAAFHPVNAVVMFWVALYVARHALPYALANKPGRLASS
jgi:hypothetical protein